MILSINTITQFIELKMKPTEVTDDSFAGYNK